MKLYRHDNKPDDCRQPHTAGDELPLSCLDGLGILHYYFPAPNPPPLPPSSIDNNSQEPEIKDLDAIAKERNYVNRDRIIVSLQGLGADYKAKIKMFYDEHMHADEEIRYILEGTGYFDVRDLEDEWLRIVAGPGDLLILPAGIYHRFTVDTKNYIHAMRLFQSKDGWAALNRSKETEENEIRRAYLRSRASKLQATELMGPVTIV